MSDDYDLNAISYDIKELRDNEISIDRCSPYFDPGVDNMTYYLSLLDDDMLDVKEITSIDQKVIDKAKSIVEEIKDNIKYRSRYYDDICLHAIVNIG